MANPSNRAKVPKDGHLMLFDNGGVGGGNTFGGAATSYVGARIREISVDLGAKEEQLVARVRGAVVSVRKGDEPIKEISFTMPFYQFTNEQQDALLDVLNNTGNINGTWVADVAWIEHWNTAAIFTAEGTTQGDTADHTAEFHGIVWTYEFTENENAFTEIAVTGRIYDYTNEAVTGVPSA